MCGIVLAVNSKTNHNFKIRNFLSDALLTSQVRGVHATGLMQLDSRCVDVFKKAMNASEFLELDYTQQMLSYACSNTFTVGHVRHATVGDKSLHANAHPFQIEREDGTTVTGVHNGSLENWRNKSGNKHDVDSNWAIELIAEKGIEAFKEIKGAYCFVWYDEQNPGMLHITRNEERPFHIAIDAKSGAMYGTSEAGMLEWLLERREIIKLEDQIILILEPHKLYSFDLDTLEFTTEDTPAYVEPPRVYTPSYTPTPYSNSHYYRNGMLDYDENGSYYSDWNERGSSTYVPASNTLDNYRMTQTMKDIGKALNPAPKLLTKDAEIEEDDIPFGKPPTETQEEALVWSLACNIITARNISSMTVTKEEQEFAKSRDIYGQMVCWEPVMYDEDNSPPDLCGDVHFMQDGQREKMQGSLRMIQKTRAYNDFLNSSKTVFPMMVVGASTDNYGDLYLILGELSSVDRTLLFSLPRAAPMLVA